MADTRPFPTITVVIPVYNKAAYVQRAITSALTQTSPADEIIIVDDASTDESAARARALHDPRIRFLSRTAPGPGGYAARNLAIGEARAEWIAFLDADDCWRPGHLDQIRNAACKNNDIGCVFTGYDHAYGEALRPNPVAPELEANAQHVTFPLFLRAWLQQNDCPMLTSASAFHRSALIEAGLFPAGRAARGGDKDLWLRVMARTPAVLALARTAVFNRTATSKVTHTAATSQPPIVCHTIAEMLTRERNTETRALLRALANHEILAYARQSFARTAIPASMRRALYLPEGWREWATLAGMEAARAPLARMIRQTLRGDRGASLSTARA